MHLHDNTVLITGGGSGIGLALARAFCNAGSTVLICGRDAEKLDAARRTESGLHTLACDITVLADRQRLLHIVREHFPRLNVLVNNAGTYQEANFSRGRIEAGAFEDELATNLLAPIELVSLFLPLLKRHPQATIINVSSALAFVPMASFPVYCATKAGLHSFSQSLRRQLAATAVQVVEVVPPSVDTAMHRTRDIPKIPPEQVAREVLRGLARDETEIHVGAAKALYLLSRLAPRFLFNALNKNG